jgi:hypothetical protein
MKNLLLLVLAGIAATGLLLAQGRGGSNNFRRSKFMTYNPGTPPPITLPEAYAAALSHLGTATNRSYCVSASCLECTNRGFTGWWFVFSNTNQERGRVIVFFDKMVSSTLRPHIPESPISK